MQKHGRHKSSPVVFPVFNKATFWEIKLAPPAKPSALTSPPVGLRRPVKRPEAGRSDEAEDEKKTLVTQLVKKTMCRILGVALVVLSSFHFCFCSLFFSFSGF